jgi:hypothetical protein
VLRESVRGGSNRLSKVEEYARNSAYVLFQFLTLNQRRDDLFGAIQRILESDALKFDPLEEPLAAAVTWFGKVRGTKAEMQRCIGRLHQIAKLISRQNVWHDRFARERLTQQLVSSASELNQQLSTLSKRR